MKKTKVQAGRNGTRHIGGNFFKADMNVLNRLCQKTHGESVKARIGLTTVCFVVEGDKRSPLEEWRLGRCQRLGV